MPLSIFLFLFSLSAFAHQSNLTQSGKALTWANKNVPVTIRNNSQTLNSTFSQQVIRNSMNEWNNSTSAQLYEASSSINEVTFSQDFSIYGSGVIGMTEIIYNEQTGNIQRAKVFLNEENYIFTSSPGFQYQSNKVFLGDVVTHELGHFLGLSHSEVLDSTMFYSSFPGQSKLAADDKAGIRAKYDLHYGKISGFIKGGKSIGVLGAHIQAISLKTGESIGAFSNENGAFEISGLDVNDSYYLYSAPIKKIDSLPSYYSSLQSSFCPTSYVGSFFNSCGKQNEGYPQKIHLSPVQNEVNVGTLTINCSLRTNEDYSYEKVQSVFQPLTIFDSSISDNYQVAFTGYFRSNELNTNSFSAADKLKVDLSHFLALSGNQKYLKLSLISQAFGSPVEYNLEVKRQNSTVLGPLQRTYRYPEGTMKLDISDKVALMPNTSLNVFDIEISGKKLASEDIADAIPSSSLFSNVQHFPYLLVASVWEQTPSGLIPYQDTEVVLSDNANCLDAPFTYAVAKAQTTALSSEKSEKEATPVTGCGTIEPPNSNGPGSSMFLLTLGFALSLIVSQVAKSRKIFLS